MSKYIVNMADQLNLIRANAQEKLRKEAEVVVEVEKPSALQTAAVDYLSRKDEPHPLSQNKNLNEETLDEGKMDGAAKDLEKEAKQNKGSMDEKSYKVMAKLMKQGNPKQILSYYKGLDTEPRERIAMILKKNIGEKQAGKILSVSFSNNREEVELDEGKFKVGDTVIPSVGPHKGRKHEVIADLKNNTYNIKPIGLLAKQIQYRLGAAKAKANQIKLVKEETLDEREKSVRQLINPTKEVMIVKKNKVIVIDKKDQDKYMKQGWTLAEEVALEEARWKVKIEGLPPIYMDSSSAGEVKAQLRKLIKKPDMIQDIERVTDAEVNKALRNKISGKEVEEAKLIDKPTGEVLKTGSKEKMETEKKRNRDELQVKEWFKLKNIDVKVRELDESTQVYVPLGKRIPNEIREELIKTQYGKMPEDVKNVKDINYGNFMENSITMNNDFWTKVLHDTKGE